MALLKREQKRPSALRSKDPWVGLDERNDKVVEIVSKYLKGCKNQIGGEKVIVEPYDNSSFQALSPDKYVRIVKEEKVLRGKRDSVKDMQPAFNARRLIDISFNTLGSIPLGKPEITVRTAEAEKHAFEIAKLLEKEGEYRKKIKIKAYGALLEEREREKELRKNAKKIADEAYRIGRREERKDKFK